MSLEPKGHEKQQSEGFDPVLESVRAAAQEILSSYSLDPASGNRHVSLETMASKIAHNARQKLESINSAYDFSSGVDPAPVKPE